MADFGFCGGAYEAASITQDAQQTVNWYPEVDATKNPGTKALNVTGDRGVIALYPAPGLVSREQPVTGPVRALREISGGAQLLAVIGRAVYLLNTGFVPTLCGNLATETGPVSVTDNGTSAYLCDGNRYALDLVAHVLTPLTDGAFVGGTVCDVIDNFIVYNRPGTRQWGATDVGAVTSSGLNLGEKVGAPDPIVALIADHREVRLLGGKTSEVWGEASTFPFAFALVPGTEIQRGIIAPFSLARLSESVAWLGRDDRGVAVVFQTSGYQANRISTHAIENDIKNGVLSDAIALSYQQRGHDFYMLTFPTQDKTWVYDSTTAMWHRRGWRDSNNVLHRHRANCCAVFNNETIVGDFENGKLYALRDDVYTDDGDAMLRRRRAPHVTNELHRVFHHSIQIQFQPGVGNDACENPQAILRWSDDGGITWGNEHFLPIGKVGQYKNRAIKRQLGQARDRVYEVSVTDPVNAVVVSADLQTSAGAA